MTQYTRDLSDGFFVRWAESMGRLGIDPFEAIRVAFSESGCRARAHNPMGNASGTIQFMPATLVGLGWSKGHSAFRELTAEQQVPYVEAYFKPWAKWCKSDALVYVATFLPALVERAAKSGNPDFVLAAIGTSMEWAYRANVVLDRLKEGGATGPDGKITVADLAAHLARQCQGPRWNEVEGRLRQAMGLQPLPPPPLSLSTREVQRLLLELGYDPGPIDGIAGPKTTKAVKKFQKAKGLAVDGIVGPVTRKALIEA